MGDRFSLGAPPPGVRILRAANGFEIRVRLRNPLIWAIFGATAAWSAFVSFALIAEAPQRTPPPVSLFVGMILFLIVFNAILLFGETRIGRNGDQGWLSFGVGPVARVRRFDWRKITGVGEEPSRWRRSGGGRPPLMQLRLKGPPGLAFGAFWTARRRAGVADALRSVLD